ncbi:MAG: ABC transporter permease [Gammaproteobacteria bacterium]|nr:ABC transporter permease [Gammaproteobacteria bacterium]
MNVVKASQIIIAASSIALSSAIFTLTIGAYQTSQAELSKLLDDINNNVLIVQRDWTVSSQVTPDFEREIKEYAEQLDGFDELALSAGGGRSTNKFSYYSILVTPNFFTVRNYPLHKGRIFASGAKEAVVGYDHRDLLGKRISVRGFNVHVVGVLKPLSRRGGPDRLVDGTVFLPYDIRGLTTPVEVFLKFNDKRTMEIAYGEIKNWLHKMNYPYTVGVLAELYGLKIRKNLRRTLGGALLGMSLIATIVMLINLYSSSFTLAIHRIREWGIRRALGASGRKIKFEAGLQNLRLLIIGHMGGAVLAVILNPVFEYFTDFKVTPTLFAWTVSGLLILTISFFSISPVLSWVGQQPPYLAIRGLATHIPRARNFMALIILITGIAALNVQLILKNSIEKHTEFMLGNLANDVAIYSSFLYLKQQSLTDPRGAAPLNYSDFLALLNSALADHLDAVSYVDNYYIFSTKSFKSDIQFFLRAYEAKYPELSGARIVLGRWPAQGRFETIVGSQLAQRMFGDNTSAIGKKLKIFGRTWTISGVFQGASRPTPGTAASDQVLILREDLKRTLPNGRGEIIVRKKPNVPDKIFEEIANFLTARHNSSDYRPVNALRRRDLAPELQDVISRLADSYSLLSLLILVLATLGIFTQTIINLRFKIRELSIRRAVGATNTQIWLETLIPATFLATMFAPLGALLGVAISAVVIKAYQITWNIPWVQVALSLTISPLIISCAITIAFKIFANKSIVEQMRTE